MLRVRFAGLVWAYYASLLLGALAFHVYLKRATGSGLIGALPREYLPPGYRFKMAVGGLSSLVWLLTPPAVLAFPSLFRHLVPITSLQLPAVQILGAGFLIVGALASLVACLQLGSSLRVLIPEESDSTKLITTGLFGKCRNPFYSGLLLSFVGILLLLPNLVLVVAMTAGVLNLHERVRVEERFLGRRFGKQYEDYCQIVPRYIPRLLNSKGPTLTQTPGN